MEDFSETVTSTEQRLETFQPSLLDSRHLLTIIPGGATTQSKTTTASAGTPSKPTPATKPAQ